MRYANGRLATLRPHNRRTKTRNHPGSAWEVSDYGTEEDSLQSMALLNVLFVHTDGTAGVRGTGRSRTKQERYNQHLNA